MKKNLLTVLILALIIVNIGLTAVMMISVTSTNKKTATLVDTIATVMNLELTGVAGETQEDATVSLADTVIYDTASLTIPLAVGEDGKKSYLVGKVSLYLNTKSDDYKTYGESISSYESAISNAIYEVVGSKTENECRNDIEGLKKQILLAIQDLFHSDFIYDVGLNPVYG